MKKKRKQYEMHPLIRAQIRAKWNSTAVSAQINTLFGDDKDKLLAYGSILFFVAGACAAHLGWTGDEPDFRIVRGSVNALDDLKDRAEITETDRGSIRAGMLAAKRILDLTPPQVIDQAALMYSQYHKQHMKGQP
jgi:predicted hotdog family 3-hydroxylacyl-ACP dehydratase